MVERYFSAQNFCFRYVGFSQVTSPVLYIKDPELIKQIYIKDSEYFPERQIYSSDDDSDPLWHKNLFSAKGKLKN